MQSNQNAGIISIFRGNSRTLFIYHWFWLFTVLWHNITAFCSIVYVMVYFFKCVSIGARIMLLSIAKCIITLCEYYLLITKMYIILIIILSNIMYSSLFVLIIRISYHIWMNANSVWCKQCFISQLLKKYVKITYVCALILVSTKITFLSLGVQNNGEFKQKNYRAQR